MNPFVYTHRTPGPELAPLAEWLRSDDFQSLTSFKDDRAMEARVAITLFMLNNVALDVPLLEAMTDCLEDGAVAMHYYSVCSPVLPFCLPKNSPQLQAIREAFQEAVLSRRFQAAVRMKYWNGYCANFSREAFPKWMDRAYKATLAWPSPEDFKSDRAEAQAQQDFCIAAQNARRAEVKKNRFAKISRIEQLTSPYRSWYQLLDAIVLEVLAPFRRETVPA